jgi:hypothetical protein
MDDSQYVLSTMKFKSLGQVEINGEKWQVGYGHPGTTNGKTDDGVCNYQKRRITINRRSTRSLLSVLAHEAIHARLPDLSEESVNATGELISEIYDLFSKHPAGQ